MANREQASGRDRFGALTRLPGWTGKVEYFRLAALEEQGLGSISRWPFSLKILLESLMRNENGFEVREEDVVRAAAWDPARLADIEIPFLPARVILQDFTGVPVVVDLAALRTAMRRLGADPRRLEPVLPVELVVDHSVQVDAYGTSAALEQNMRLEFERNAERYTLLKWGQQAFERFRVTPPGVGIVHQVNLELLARVVFRQPAGDGEWVYPDSVLGTDSHTPMVNGLGVLGWGVGGIEAEAAMLGQPLSMLFPDVLGVKLTGALPPGATATDLALTLTQRLRQHGVVGKFVEFFGRGLSAMALADRATIANMAPEYGATASYFPWDLETLRYLRQTGRSAEQVALVEQYAREQGLFRTDETPDPVFPEVLEFDLGQVEPSLAGPKRPQDRVPLARAAEQFCHALSLPPDQRGYGLPAEELTRTGEGTLDGQPFQLGHGSVAIAAITSCTNTSNPSVMLQAGLLAKKAVARGLKVGPAVKTSLAPGSRVVTEYLRRVDLLRPLEELGFAVVGYGCTTCIGNSGPLPEPVAEAITGNRLIVAAVLSGNRNFEGRINPHTRANYLASPPLVVAYALAGSLQCDLTREPLGHDPDGRPVFLAELWPTPEELADCLHLIDAPEDYLRLYGELAAGSPEWNRIPAATGELYPWQAESSYIQEPPFVTAVERTPATVAPIRHARVLALLGDSITTDHISPAGSIAEHSPAGRYLRSLGIERRDFNSYGARRGNDRVMVRGTFANTQIRNRLVPGVEGGFTRHLPSGEVLSIYDAAQRYAAEGTPLLVVAGREYGTGSSRDWAAKGTALLGVRAVLAQSFERIHRSNLVGMGVLPLEFRAGESAGSLGLTGEEQFDLELPPRLTPRQELELIVHRTGEPAQTRLFVVARLDTPAECEIYRQGGLLPAVLRRMLDA